MSIAGINFYSHATELLINAYEKKIYLLDLANCTSSISRLVPWSLLTQIIVDNENTISATELEAILEIAYNVDTLEINDEDGILPRAILSNTGHLATRINRQVSISFLKRKVSFKFCF
jgi:hypothetical protein